MVEDPLPSLKNEPATIEIADPGGRLSHERRSWLMTRLAAATNHLGAPGEVRVRLVGDDEMAAAHLRHSHVPGTTDVLTFDLREKPQPSGPLDAELLLCVDEARRQAGSRGHAIERELLLYALHGILHCLGEDDHDAVASARMHTREDEVLRAIGVGPTYQAQSMSGPGEVGGAGGPR